MLSLVSANVAHIEWIQATDLTIAQACKRASPALQCLATFGAQTVRCYHLLASMYLRGKI